MIINSSELRGAGFNLKPEEVLPPELEAAARGGKRTQGAGLVLYFLNAFFATLFFEAFFCKG